MLQHQVTSRSLTFLALTAAGLIAYGFIGSVLVAQSPRQLPALGEVVQSGRDLWGEASMQQRNGANYEFFRPVRFK